jgi:hypothetical protein
VKHELQEDAPHAGTCAARDEEEAFTASTKQKQRDDGHTADDKQILKLTEARQSQHWRVPGPAASLEPPCDGSIERPQLILLNFACEVEKRNCGKAAERKAPYVPLEETQYALRPSTDHATARRIAGQWRVVGKHDVAAATS